MFAAESQPARSLLCGAVAGLALLCGCAIPGGHKTEQDIKHADMPRELQKVTLPPYVIEPPDILVINVIRAVPRPPYRIQALDVISVEDGLPPPPPPTEVDVNARFRFTGNYSVEPGGTIDLGAFFGRVRVGNLTIEDAKRAIQRHVEMVQPKTVVQRVGLVQMSSMQQQVSGEHLVIQDGTISLGTYGRVYVTGMTVDQARFAIEAQLSAFLDQPQVSVDVSAYNSKVYYVITQGTIVGDGVQRIPVTGNETVLDAISQIQGFQPQSSHHVWVARPAPPGGPCTDQVMPVDWLAVSRLGSTATNYQIMPGDRVYISEDPWITIDGGIAKIQSPFERMMGFVLLGNSMVRAVGGQNQGGGGVGGGGGF